MRKKGFTSKGVSLLLSASLCVGMMSALSGCGSKKDEVIKLDVYSQRTVLLNQRIFARIEQLPEFSSKTPIAIFAVSRRAGLPIS